MLPIYKHIGSQLRGYYWRRGGCALFDPTEEFDVVGRSACSAFTERSPSEQGDLLCIRPSRLDNSLGPQQIRDTYRQTKLNPPALQLLTGKGQ